MNKRTLKILFYVFIQVPVGLSLIFGFDIFRSCKTEKKISYSAPAAGIYAILLPEDLKVIGKIEVKETEKQNTFSCSIDSDSYSFLNPYSSTKEVLQKEKFITGDSQFSEFKLNKELFWYSQKVDEYIVISQINYSKMTYLNTTSLPNTHYILSVMDEKQYKDLISENYFCISEYSYINRDAYKYSGLF